jgi:hypothetical protein
MEEPRIKAYGFVATLGFVDEHYDEAGRARIHGALSPEARAFIGNVKKSQVASQHADAKERTDQLVKVGRAIGALDANFGEITPGDLTDIEKGQFSLKFAELGPFPYFGSATEGWLTFALETMGLRNLRVALQGWSTDNPAASEADYRITWSR